MSEPDGTVCNEEFAMTRILAVQLCLLAVSGLECARSCCRGCRSPSSNLFEGVCRACKEWVLKTVQQIMASFVSGISEVRVDASGHWVWGAQWGRSDPKWRRITRNILGGEKGQAFTEAFVEYIKVNKDNFASVDELVNDLKSKIVAKYAKRERQGGDGNDSDGDRQEEELQKFSTSMVDQLSRTITVCH